MTSPARLEFSLVLCAALASPGLADDKAAPATDPMAGWAPPVVKSEKKDRAERPAASPGAGSSGYRR